MEQGRLTKHFSALLAEQAGHPEAINEIRKDQKIAKLQDVLAQAYTELDFLENALQVIQHSLKHDDAAFAKRIADEVAEGIENRIEAAKNARH